MPTLLDENEAPLPNEKQNNPPLKSETYFQEMIPRKKTPKIPQERNFLTWSIQNFVRKVKQFL